MSKRIILALDGMDKKQIYSKLDQQFSSILTVKIGLELYTRYGNSFIIDLHKKYKKNIFLDLKLHDIPTTISNTIQSLSNLPIKFLTIHLNGGEEMIKQTLKQAKISLPNTKILGVTILTSISKTEIEKIYNRSFEELFTYYLKLALNLQLSGIICSVKDLKYVKKIDTNQSLIKICPGIRFTDDAKHDQSRVATPDQAISKGANYLVIGRSLTLENEQKIKEKICFIEKIP